MKKYITSLFFLLLLAVNTNAQEIDTIVKDSIVYDKNTAISEGRNFPENINDIYSGKDFKYVEEEPEVKEKSKPLDTGLVNFIVFFMSKIFPFLLGGFIILIILKSFIGFDARFWKTTNKKLKTNKKLIYEDEDINEIDLELLLKNALVDKDYRLAIRYYYLTILKHLSQNNLIDYHKDKTNSEYLFEIENKEHRNQFSYLSYVYSYVWYGEFPVDETNFKVAENKYQSFLKSIN